MHQVIGSAVEKASAQWEGEVRLVLPIGRDVQGMRYKIILGGVPSELFTYVALPAMRGEGLVKVQSREEVEAQKTVHEMSRKLKPSNRRVLGDAGRQQDMLEKLVNLRGEGGSAATQQEIC